jgi:hypothetical protein
MMKFFSVLLLTTLLFTSCNNSDRKRHEVEEQSSKWIFDKTDSSVLKFKNGKKFDTHLYELKYIGQIKNGIKAPFLIFSGRDCDECDENISIYIHSPANGPLTVANGHDSYGFPGTEQDYENDSLVYKARAFYGQVLPNINGVIWYQLQLMEDNSYQHSAFLVDLRNGLQKDTVFRDTSKLKLTLNLLKQGLCREIKGVDYTSEP